MPKLTLLDMTQSILSDMSSDEVNSISDTIEALQVAQIIKDTYYNLIDGRDWPHLYQMFQLTPSGNATNPTTMTLPEGVIDVIWVKYNVMTATDTANKFQLIAYKTPQEFMALLDTRLSDADNVLIVTDTSNDIPLNIYTDRAPTYYTSFDNEYIVFDAYDSDVEETLQNDKTQSYGRIYPSWTMDDDFIPDLPIQSFSYLLNEAKATASLKLLQAADVKAEQHAVTQRRRMSQDAWRLNRGISRPNYGRKGHKNG